MAHALEKVHREHKASLTDRIANSEEFFRNWYYPGGAEKFPTDAICRKVDRYYPYAEGGPLCIDIFDDPTDVDRRKEEIDKKTPVLKEAGLRYLLLKPHMDFNLAMQELEQA